MKKKDQELLSDRKILHCPGCGQESSGSVGGYWYLPDNYVFLCSCGAEMELVNKIVSIIFE